MMHADSVSFADLQVLHAYCKHIHIQGADRISLDDFLPMQAQLREDMLRKI